MCYNCRHMRYTHLKKVLLVAVFSVLAVLVVLPVRSAYAEETAEPTKAECYDKTWTKSGDKDQGYSCSNGATTVGPYKFECPSGYEKNTTATKFKCVKAAPPAPAPTAGSSVEPTRKNCNMIGFDGDLKGDNNQGYWCYYNGWFDKYSFNVFLECPAGSYVSGEDTSGIESPRPSGGVKKKKCAAGSRSTVEPAAKACYDKSSTLKGDKNSGYFCERGGVQSRPYSFTCPAGSKQTDGNSINWRTGENVTFAQICVGSSSSSSTLTPEQRQKVKEAEAEASGKDLLSKSPELAKITSDPKVVGECLIRATGRATATMLRLGLMKSGSRASLENNYRRQFLAECLSEKTGKSVDEIKAALEGIDLQGSVAAGESARAATEQQLAQEQAAEGEEEKPKEECGGHVEGIGYFLCPILERLVDFADGTWGLFEYLLQTNPLPDDTSKPLPSAWSGLRDVANAILAIIFLAIIISQVSNIGISNYGVKKMLPRLIIAAIAINMSYFLMQIITDIANILGSTLYDFISELAPKVQYRDVGWATIITDIAATGIAVAAIGAGATAAGHAMSDMDPKVGLLLLFVFIVPAILGLIAGLMALVFRAGIIPVLAISAPIAFAAWVLPNTQKLFEKWKSTFLGMIFLYPLASLYCGGLKFVALSLMSENTEPQQVLFRMMGVTMLLLGSGFVAVLAIKSNSIMGGMMNGIKNIGTKLTAPAVNSLASYAGALKGAKRAEFLAKDHSKAAEAAERNRYHRLDPRRLRARVKHATGRRMQAHDERMAQAKMQAKVYESAVEQEERRKYEARVAENPALLGRVAETVGGKSFIKEAAYKAANMELSSKYNGNAVEALNNSSNEYVKALAAKEIAERNSAGEIAQVREYLENGGTIDNTDMAEALQKMKKRDAGIAEVGEKAMDRLKQSGGAPVSFNKNEIAQLTKEGFAGVGGDVQAAEQNAAAIQGSDMSWQQAERILGDRHVMRTTPEKNVTAIEAKLEVGLAEDIKNNKISQEQAMKIVTNERIVEHVSSDVKDKLLDIATRPAGQASGGGQPVTSSGQARQGHSAGQPTQRPPVTPSSPPGRT